MPKLCVGTPWASPFMWTGYVDAMLNLEKPEGWEVKFVRGKGWCPARRHISICEKALDWGADLICIVGADQIHPPDMLKRLIKRVEEGYEIVSALVPARGYVQWQPMLPFQPMAWRFKPTQGNQIRQYRGMDLDGDMIHVIDPKDGDIQRVNFIGSGVLMFQRDHLLSLEKPWFKETIDPSNMQRTANMDCLFVWRLQSEAGAKVWVDTTIKVKHIHGFEIDDTFSGRFKDWAKGGGDKSVCVYRPGETAGEEDRDLTKAPQKGIQEMRKDMILGWAGDLTGKSVLEVGYDRGRYLKIFSDAGAKVVVGVDPVGMPDIELPDNVVAIPKKLEDAELDVNFDVVHLGEVLEHVEDPDSMLNYCLERWPDAVYLISLPNFYGKNHVRSYTLEKATEYLYRFFKIHETKAIQWKFGNTGELYKWWLFKCSKKPEFVCV